MTKFSWSSSPKKKLRFVLVFLAGLLICTAVSNGIGTFLLQRRLRQAQRLFQETGLADLRVRAALFNIFCGITLKDVVVGRDGKVFFAAGELKACLDAASLSRGDLRVKSVTLRGARIFLQKVSLLGSLMREAAARLGDDLKIAPTVYFKGRDVWFDDVVLADARGYASAVPGGLLTSRGALVLKKVKVLSLGESDILQGSHFYKPFDFVFEAEPQGEDLSLSRIELSNSFLRFTGNGRIRRAGRAEAEAAFVMHFMNIILDDLPALGSKNFKLQGVVDALLEVKGPLGDPEGVFTLKLANVQCDFFQTVELSGINGSAVIMKDRLLSRGLEMVFNGFRLSADVEIEQGEFPYFQVRLAAPAQKASEVDLFVVDVGARWQENALVGDAKVRLRYFSPDAVNTVSFGLERFRLGLDEDIFLSAAGLDFSWWAEPADRPAVGGGQRIFTREFAATRLTGALRRAEGRFSLEELKAFCYGGILEGAVDFISAETDQSVKGELHLRDVRLNEFFGKEEEAVSLGSLDGDLRFDTRASDRLRGQFFVTAGSVDQNPLLNAVADFLGVASLKKLAYDELSMFFAGGRGDYTSQVKLKSPSVQAHLDVKIAAYDKMDGYLAVAIATERLNESKQFKKILAYLRHDEPSVIFPFKISSYIHSPRVLWLKNEFKEKFQNLLPERNKRFLQRQVNDMVETMKEE